MQFYSYIKINSGWKSLIAVGRMMMQLNCFATIWFKRPVAAGKAPWATVQLVGAFIGAKRMVCAVQCELCICNPVGHAPGYNAQRSRTAQMVKRVLITQNHRHKAVSNWHAPVMGYAAQR